MCGYTGFLVLDAPANSRQIYSVFIRSFRLAGGKAIKQGASVEMCPWQILDGHLLMYMRAREIIEAFSLPAPAQRTENDASPRGRPLDDAIAATALMR
jgi:hypothetical protein